MNMCPPPYPLPLPNYRYSGVPVAKLKVGYIFVIWRPISFVWQVLKVPMTPKFVLRYVSVHCEDFLK